MSEISIRKSQLIVDKIWHDGGPALKEPRLRGAILTVIKNPFAGRYVEDIQPFMKPLEQLGVGMARELAEALGGPKAVQSYGKAAIVGLDGELEHGALWHAPGGYSMREVLGGTKAIVPSTKKVGPGRRAHRRAAASHQRRLCAQPFRHHRGRHQRRAQGGRDHLHPRHGHRPAGA